MSNLKPAETRVLERMLLMGSGYVLDFSNRTMAEFFEAEIGLDIYDERWAFRGESKANRMRAFWTAADEMTVARVLRGLWSCRLEVAYGDPPTEQDRQKYFAIIAKLEGDAGTANTDGIERFSRDETLEELVAAIERDVQAGSPNTALDRLHTYCMKKFAHLIHEHQPDIIPAATLNGRAGQYLNSRKKEAKSWRPVSFEIMTATVKIFEQFNDTRNNASLAHDNTIVSKAEARFIFDGVVNLLRFLKATEGESFGS